MQLRTLKYLMATGLALTMLNCGDASQAHLTAEEAASAHGVTDLNEFEPCSIDSTCAEGFVCRGTCIPVAERAGAFGGSCGVDADCDAGLACSDSVCVDPELLVDYIAGLTMTEEEYFGDQPLVITPEETTRSQPLTPSTADLGALRPSRVDLRDTGFLPRPANQGAHGSCMAFAAGYGLASYIEAKQNGRNISRVSGDHEYIMSPAYLYNKTRQIEGRCNTSGSSISGGMRVLRDHGIPSARTVPYQSSILNACATGLDARGQQEARNNRIRTYERIFISNNHRSSLDTPIMSTSQLDRIRNHLAQGRPVVVGIRTPGNIQRLNSRNSRIDLPLTRYSRPQNGLDHSYHGVLAVGYDDARQELILLNSWGRWWGDGGWFTMSYDASRYIIFEAMTTSDASTPVQPTPVPSGCNDAPTSCRDNSVVSQCNGSTQIIDQCGASRSCVEQGNSASCVQSSGRCGGQIGQACGRSRDGSTWYVVETCDGGYLDTLEECTGLCTRSGGTPRCEGSSQPEPEPQPQPSGGEALEVRIQWTAGEDVDLFLTEEGAGTYSYSSTPRGHGQFDNSASCFSNNAYCSSSQVSVERVTWSAERFPSGNLSFHVRNYSGNAAVPFELVILRDGEVSVRRDFTVPAGRGARTSEIAIQLRR